MRVGGDVSGGAAPAGSGLAGAASPESHYVHEGQKSREPDPHFRRSGPLDLVRPKGLEPLTF